MFCEQIDSQIDAVIAKDRNLLLGVTGCRLATLARGGCFRRRRLCDGCCSCRWSMCLKLVLFSSQKVPKFRGR